MTDTHAQPLSEFKAATGQEPVTAFTLSDKTLSGLRPRVLITMHGIRDEGALMNVRLTNIFKHYSYDLEICPISYPRCGTLRFAFGIRRQRLIEDVSRQFENYINEYRGSLIDVFCHSNGTKLLYEVLSKINYDRLRYVVFAGSICKRADARIVLRSCAYFINDCGSEDPWPIFARAVRPDLFEDTGVFGFRTNGVNDCMFRFGHSGAIEKSHIERYIVPILLDNNIFWDEAAEPPCSLHNHKYYRITIIMVIALLAFSIFYFLC